MSSSITSGSVVLFGPEITEWSEQQLRDLQRKIVSDERLEFIRNCLCGLPSIPLWQGSETTSAPWRPLAAAASQHLGGFGSGRGLAVSDISRNSLLAPLTVVDQAVNFMEAVESQGQISTTKSAAFPAVAVAQGFCIGFLSSAAVATSLDWAQFERNICKAIRTAVCIGSIVDYQRVSRLADSSTETVTGSLSVRWKSGPEKSRIYTQVDSTAQVCGRTPIIQSRNYTNLAQSYISCVTDENKITITAGSEDIGRLSAFFTENNMSHVKISVEGSYHSSRNEGFAAVLKSMCKEDRPNFQLCDGDSLLRPLRSTADGEILSDEVSLSDTAIDLILCTRADWFQTVQKTLSHFPKAEVVLVGRGSFIPRSLIGSNPTLKAGQKVSDYKMSSDTITADQSYAPGNNDVAVIGMSCRYPGAETLEGFWELITSGGTALGKVPSSRFDTGKIKRGPKLDFWGNFLRDPDSFDNKFFGNSGREAKSMDPQQRLAMHVAYEALESSGYFSKCNDSRIKDVGCYLGVGAVDYEDNIASEDANAYAALGTLRAFISGRISHFFGWSGPSITFDTACSSSIVAIHSACRVRTPKRSKCY